MFCNVFILCLGVVGTGWMNEFDCRYSKVFFDATAVGTANFYLDTFWPSAN